MSKLCIGIDLGTTNSCVAIYRNGKPEVIVNELGERTTPSMVAFNDSEKLVGNAAKTQQISNPENTIYAIKRIIGRKYKDVEVQKEMARFPFTVAPNDKGNPVVVVTYKGEKKEFAPEMISSLILMKMKEYAENVEHGIKDAVVTIPAYFNDAQREATLNAAKIADLNILRMINEPTAAALAYGFQQESSSEPHTVLVFDLGGGTFDVTIIEIDESTFEVKSTNGDTHLGGEDFDNRLVDYFSERFERKYGIDPRTNPRSKMLLKQHCQKAKHTLTSSTRTTVNIDSLINGNDLHDSISQAEFEFLCEDDFNRCLDPVSKCLDDAGLDKSDITDILLVGGSTRIPRVLEILSEFFEGSVKPAQTIDPDEAVALGAAIQAAIIKKAGAGGTGSRPDTSSMHASRRSGPDSGFVDDTDDEYDSDDPLNEILLVDVTPLTIGCKVQGGIMQPLISRNSTIPTKKSYKFATSQDEQERAVFTIYQGERSMVRDNLKIGQFEMKGLPKKPKGEIIIEFRIEIDASGIIKCSAFDSTDPKHSVDYSVDSKKGGLSESDIEKLIREADHFRKEDEAKKKYALTLTAFETYLYQARTAAAKCSSPKNRALVVSEVFKGIDYIDENRDPPSDLKDVERAIKEIEDEFKKYQKIIDPLIA